MTLPTADLDHDASQAHLRTSAPQRRAIARRFSCPHDPNWAGVMRVLIAAGIAAAVVAVMLRIEAPSWVIALLPLAMLQAASRASRSQVDLVMRWDGLQWWIDVTPGESLAVVPHVLIDLEHWMLLRLTRDDAFDASPRWSLQRWRDHRPRWLAVSRRGVGAPWAHFRLHLFLARG